MKNRRVLLSFYLKKPATICFAINIFVIIVIFLFSSKLPPIVPLFYGQPQGEEQLANNTLLTLPAILANIFILVNFIIEKTVQDNFLHKVLVGLMVGCTVLSTITIVKIILLVGNL